MLNKKIIREMQAELKAYEKSHNEVNQIGREIIRLSKKMIYALHRNSIAEARHHQKTMRKQVRELKRVASKHAELKGLSIYRVALQEYVEAECFLSYITSGNIPLHTRLGTDAHTYLGGLCDLSGELFRFALHSSIKGDFDMVERVTKIISKIYNNLLEFSFRDSDLRRKVDKVRYDLEKLEAMLFEIQRRR